MLLPIQSFCSWVKCSPLGHASAVDEFCSQHLRARGFFDDGGDVVDIRFVGEELAETSAHFRFPNVVTFPGELCAGVSDCFVEVETFGKEAGGCEEDSEI